MTKKGGTRILIVIVAGLWAYNIYRTVENYQIKAETQELNDANRFNFSPMVFNKDSFDLVLADVDPFLKDNKYWKKNTSISNSQPNQSKDQKKENRTVNLPKAASLKWPKINYFGYVKNKDQGKTLCLISINGRTTRLAQGDILEGIQLVQTYRDSVILQLNDSKKTFFKVK